MSPPRPACASIPSRRVTDAEESSVEEEERLIRLYEAELSLLKARGSSLEDETDSSLRMLERLLPPDRVPEIAILPSSTRHETSLQHEDTLFRFQPHVGGMVWERVEYLPKQDYLELQGRTLQDPNTPICVRLQPTHRSSGNDETEETTPGISVAGLEDILGHNVSPVPAALQNNLPLALMQRMQFQDFQQDRQDSLQQWGQLYPKMDLLLQKDGILEFRHSTNDKEDDSKPPVLTLKWHWNVIETEQPQLQWHSSSSAALQPQDFQDLQELCKSPQKTIELILQVLCGNDG